MKMKSLLAFFLTFVLVVACFSGITVVSADVEGDFEYTIEGDGAALTEYTGSDKTVNIPETLGGKPVVSIELNAFYNQAIETVTMPDTVVSINGAFRYSSLKTITLSQNLQSIDNSAFEECKSLVSVAIPDSVTTIGKEAFDGCVSLTSANLPANLIELGDEAFYGCEKLASVITIPSGITEIPNSCFSKCKTIPQVVFHDDVAVIGQYAFSGCSSIKTLVLPKSINDLGYACFSGCSNLEELTVTSEYEPGFLSEPFTKCNNLKILNISEDVNTVTQDMVSFGAGSVETVNIAEGVTKIDEKVFLNFVKLTSVSLPSTLTDIGGRAFGGCSELAEITIPTSVTAIGANAFADTRLYKTASNWEDNVLYVGDCLIEIDDEFKGNLVVKDGTRLIAEGAFNFRTELTGIRLPASIKVVGDTAFNSYNYNLDTFIYDGNKEDWKNVTVGIENDKLTDLNPVYVTGGSYGDVNEDGKVDASDALEILKSVVGKVELTARQTIVADVDAGEKVDAADALFVLKKVVGKVDAFSAEIPALRMNTTYRGMVLSNEQRVEILDLKFLGQNYVDATFLTYTADVSVFDDTALAEIPSITVDGKKYYEMGGYGGEFFCSTQDGEIVIYDNGEVIGEEVCRLQKQGNGDLLCVFEATEVYTNQLFRVMR